MASIGDLLLKVSADLAGFETEVIKGAQTAGDKAGQTLGQRMSSGLKSAAATGFKALAAGGALVFGAMAKGALEMENATARYRAETGATVEESRAAARSFNAIAGDQRQSLESVTDAAIAVRQNLGLVGKAADEATSDFVEFARVTGQDATAAVRDFDDVLDAWGLTAGRSREIQDKLLRSNQKYGGSITENQQALGKLAPQLKALNLDVDDGIGLLNLFAASGIDASKAQFALNSAIQKLPEGESLDEFIARLSLVEDDGERARMAIEVFGARGGAGLANAIRPGIDSLDAFAISTEDATGAVDEAAEAIDSTFSARVQRLISQTGAKLREFGADLGPAITGIASLGSLAGSLGLGRLFRGLKVPTAALKGFGGKAAAAIGTGLASAGGVLSSGVASAIDAIPGSSKVKGAIGRVRKFLGSRLGAGLVITVGLVIAKEALDGLAETTSEQITKAATEGNLAALKASRDVMKASLGGNNILGIANFDLFGLQEGMKRNLAETEAAIVELEAKGQKAGAGFTAAVGDALRGGANAVATAAQGGIYDPITGAVRDARDDAVETATQTPQDIADGLRAGRDAVASAASALEQAIEDELTPGQEAVKLIGLLTGEALVKALKSKDPALRAQAEATRDIWETRLAELIPEGAKLGKGANQALIDGMASKDGAVRDASQRTRDVIERNLKPKAGAIGEQVPKDIAAGMKRTSGIVFTAATNFANLLAQRIRGALFGSLGVGGGGTKSSKDTDHLSHGGIVTVGTVYEVNERDGQREFFAPSVGGRMYPSVESGLAATGGGQGGNTYQVTVSGLVRATDPFEVATQMRRLGELGDLTRTPRLKPSREALG